MGKKDASGTSGLGIIIRQWHFGRSLLALRVLQRVVGYAVSQGGRGVLARWYSKLLWSFAEVPTRSLPSSQFAFHSSQSQTEPFSTYTCLTSCLLPRNSFFPLKTGLDDHSRPVLLVPGCLGGRATMASETVGKSSALRHFRSYYLPKCATAFGPETARAGAMLLVCCRQGL